MRSYERLFPWKPTASANSDPSQRPACTPNCKRDPEPSLTLANALYDEGNHDPKPIYASYAQSPPMHALWAERLGNHDPKPNPDPNLHVLLEGRGHRIDAHNLQRRCQ